MLKDSKAFSSFTVSDISKAKDFYGNILGLEVSDVPEMQGLLELRIKDSSSIMIYAKPDHKPADFTVLNFQVEYINAEMDKLAGKGVKYEQYTGEIKTDEKGIMHGEGYKICWFKDPFGNILSLIQENKNRKE